MNGTTIVERAAELIQTEVDGDLIALDIDQGNCFGFNATATRVWQLLDRPRSIDFVVDALTTEFEIERADCEVAVTGLVQDFLAQKLVKTSQPG